MADEPKHSQRSDTLIFINRLTGDVMDTRPLDELLAKEYGDDPKKMAAFLREIADTIMEGHLTADEKQKAGRVLDALLRLFTKPLLKINPN